MRTLKDLEDAYSFMRDPAIWDAIQIVKERDARIEELEAALREIAQHDLQAIAIDALHPNERIRAALGEKKDE